MDMTGEYRIPAPRQKVWEALNDPEVLRRAIPGCESIEKTSDTEMTAKVAAKVGPVSAKFSGKVTLSDLDPPNGYRISGEGSGGAAGFAKGGATVKLTDDGAGGTLLSYKVDAQIGGKLAQIGSRLIDGVSRKMADDFFSRFSAEVGAASPAPEAPAEEILPVSAPAAPISLPSAASGTTIVPPTPAAAPQPQTIMPPPRPASTPPASSGIRLPPWAWIAGLVVVVAIILFVFA